MSSVNKVIIIGNLGQDPQIHHTQDGRAIANISVATADSWKDKATGEKREKTEWHRVVVFNEGLAKVVEKFLKKGSKVYIEGKLQTRKWQDQQGVDKYTTEIVLQGFDSKLVMLSTRQNQDPGYQSNEYADSQNPPNQSNQQDVHPDLDDDIPF